jgi:plasmid stabilization system protein ParE
MRRSTARSMTPRLVARWTRQSISGSIAPVVKVVLLDEAQRRFEEEDAWWRDHRDAKELFVEEFAETIDQLTFMPGKGQRYRLARGKLIQRVLMKKTGCHVYYFYDRERDLIEVTRSGERVESGGPDCRIGSV